MNTWKVENVKKFLTESGIFFEEHKNGHLKVDRVNLWVTTEKWYDEITGKKGVGINSFLAYIKKNR